MQEVGLCVVSADAGASSIKNICIKDAMQLVHTMLHSLPRYQTRNSMHGAGKRSLLERCNITSH